MKTIITVALISLLTSCNLPTPAAGRVEKVDTAGILTAYQFELFRQMSDSMNLSIARGWKYRSAGEIDSAFLMLGRANAYQQLEHQFSK